MDMTPNVTGTLVDDPLASNVGRRSTSGWRLNGDSEWGCSASVGGEEERGDGRARARGALRRRDTTKRRIAVGD